MTTKTFSLSAFTSLLPVALALCGTLLLQGCSTTTGVNPFRMSSTTVVASGAMYGSIDQALAACSTKETLVPADAMINVVVLPDDATAGAKKSSGIRFRCATEAERAKRGSPVSFIGGGGSSDGDQHIAAVPVALATSDSVIRTALMREAFKMCRTSLQHGPMGQPPFMPGAFERGPVETGREETILYFKCSFGI
jgi:hypothetical protein